MLNPPCKRVRVELIHLRRKISCMDPVSVMKIRPSKHVTLEYLSVPALRYHSQPTNKRKYRQRSLFRVTSSSISLVVSTNAGETRLRSPESIAHQSSSLMLSSPARSSLSKDVSRSQATSHVKTFLVSHALSHVRIKQESAQRCSF